MRRPDAPRLAPPRRDDRRAAVPAGVEAGRAAGVRAVVSTSQPIAAHEAGMAVAEALGVPWVADFRDPMTEAPGRSWPTRPHYRAERREEERFVTAASLVWA